MSSILKALKKLEDEHPRVADGTDLLPRTPGVKKTLRRWEINSGKFAPVLWTALTAVVLVTAAWFLIYMRSPDPPPASSTELLSAPLNSPAALQPKPTAVNKTTPATRQSKSKATANRRSPRTAQPAARSPKMPPMAARTQRSASKQSPSLPPPASRAGLSTQAGLSVLQSDLELQAISWASDAADRIAVINGNIVREGGAIEGYTVIRIDQDQVVVRKGLSDWKLVFSLNR